MFSNRNDFRRRSGVTLLELLLALALSVVVLAAIGMAINLHFKMFDVRRTSLEEMQVVRAVTRRMTDDIRMLVQPNEPDLSGLETAFQNAIQAASKQAEAAAGGAVVLGGSGDADNQSGGGNNTGGGNQSGSGERTSGGNQSGQGQSGQSQGEQNGQAGNAQNGQAGGSGKSGQTGGGSAGKASGGAQASNTGSGSGSTASGGTSASASGTDTAATDSSTKTASVQLYGSATELRLDISRLPRIDQYQGILSAQGELSAVDLPSDVKTVVYFLRSDASAATYTDNPNAAGGEPSTDGYGRGLMRCEMDRAVTTWAETNGSTDSVYAGAQLLAEEVVGLGFEYFDGLEWYSEWDSASYGSLPRAIRIWLSVQPTYGMSEQELAEAAGGKEVASTDFYFVVSLPIAPLVATPPTETTDTTGASSSSSATSQSTGTATQGAMP